MCFTVLGDSGDAPVRCFLDFFTPLPSKTPTFESISGKLLSRRPVELQKVTILTTDENLPRAVAQGLLFGVHKRSLGGARSQGGVSPVVGHTARGREVGGTRFDSRLARRVVFTAKTRKK